MPERDILDEVAIGVSIDRYRRLSPLQTLRLSILELLLARPRRNGTWTIARAIYYQLEGVKFSAEPAYLTLVNQALAHLAGKELIELVQITKGRVIRSASITDKGRERLRTLLELERSDYPAFLEAMMKL